MIGTAGLGNTLGIALASLLKNVNPKLTVVLALVADTVATLVAALFYGVPSLALLALVAGLGQSLAKVSLDATIQRDVHESIQASAFARSDTTLQLAWVIGGFVGIAMPLEPPARPRRRVRRTGRVGDLRAGHPAATDAVRRRRRRRRLPS